MTAAHPNADEIQSFGLGRLIGEDAARVEEHVLHCEQCCARLRTVGSDTLLNLAQVAVKTAQLTAIQNLGIPKELVDHPRYRILCQVGEGGMGTVFKAEHRFMDRPVALKVIQQKYVNNRDAVERFRNEVRMAARLSHPNIVAAHDAEEAGGVHFLVMEFVDGISLDRFTGKQKGKVPVALAGHIIRQAALGLQHAHQHGLVHRDIKPQNIMITRKGQVKVLDFGLTRLADESEIDPCMTAENLVVGTPDFIAPEQARNSHDVDIRTDIYALGCTFYFLLTKRVPFPMDSPFEKMLAHAEAKAKPISQIRSDVPREVEAIVDRMMAKRREDRFQTPAELASALHAFSRLNHSHTTANVSAQPVTAGEADAEVLELEDALERIETDDIRNAKTETVDSFRDKSRLVRRRKKKRPEPYRKWLTAAIVATCLLFALIAWAAMKGGSGNTEKNTEPPNPKAVPNEPLKERERDNWKEKDKEREKDFRKEPFFPKGKPFPFPKGVEPKFLPNRDLPPLGFGPRN